ncbi:hypothetical protein BaRGS_00030532 [Batillaria attramentaria]|uniref:Uncharacterized protein n=1 Tax=Batillaria attramentaria TaxID=370345 RepID=A0ABD0JU88_9CAEN
MTSLHNKALLQLNGGGISTEAQISQFTRLLWPRLLLANKQTSGACDSAGKQPALTNRELTVHFHQVSFLLYPSQAFPAVVSKTDCCPQPGAAGDQG